MKHQEVDIVIVGAGPVGLMCAYLSMLCGLSLIIIDKSGWPLKVGRADALNARTLQLLEVINIFDLIYPLGKTCNTSSVWSAGKFVSRQSSWWEALEGCFHKHFLMIGQSYIENILDNKLKEIGTPVKRATEIVSIDVTGNGCVSTLSNDEKIFSKYVIGADGSRSFVRNYFQIPFEITRPQIIWAVIDGVINTDFEKVPEIIVFQNKTSDVAWIPREGDIDRFYVRMDNKEFTQEEVIEKINVSISPYKLSFDKIIWFSSFSVKESVAEKFFIRGRIFLAGDSCHIHSVNGGQGLNTGLSDAFNLIWKLHMVINFSKSKELLKSYEDERKPVAKSVIETSGELVRATKHSLNETHANDYVGIVQKRAGNITGMGIRYSENGLEGTRLFDLVIYDGAIKTRLYTLIDYTKFTLLIFSNSLIEYDLPEFVNVIHINKHRSDNFWTEDNTYKDQCILVRPDAYIDSCVPNQKINEIIKRIRSYYV